MDRAESTIRHSERKMFSTELGSDYYLLDSGYWYRRLICGTSFHNYLYVGSIDKFKNGCFEKNGSDKYDYSRLVRQLLEGKIEGFIPGFEVGMIPLGVCGVGPEEIIYDGGITLKNRRNLVGIHSGHRITKIHEENLAKDQRWLELILAGQQT